MLERKQMRSVISLTFCLWMKSVFLASQIGLYWYCSYKLYHFLYAAVVFCSMRNVSVLADPSGAIFILGTLILSKKKKPYELIKILTYSETCLWINFWFNINCEEGLTSCVRKRQGEIPQFCLLIISGQWLILSHRFLI